MYILFLDLLPVLEIPATNIIMRRENKIISWVSIVGGALVLLLGILIRHLIKRRRFYRRNVAGLESFHSYTRSVLIPFIEGIFNLLGLLLILSGGIVLLFGIFTLYDQQ